MKKILCMLSVVLLLCSMLIPATAASPEPKITMQPQNTQYSEYAVAIYTVKAEGSNLSATWYLEYEGKTYNVSDMTNGFEPWEAYAGESYGPYQNDANTFSCIFEGIGAELNGARIWCVIEDGHYSVESEKAIITVQDGATPPQIIRVPAGLTCYRGDTESIRCEAISPSEDVQLSYAWYETSTGKLQDIQIIFPEETSDFLFVNTENVGTRYYVCCVTTSDGGRAYSSVIPVTVLDSDPAPEMEILTKKLPEGVVGQSYRCEIECNDPYGLITLYYNPGRQNQFEETGLRLTKENMILGTPAKAGSFTFTVCASGDYGEDYMQYTLVIREAPQTPEETEPNETDPVETTPAETDPKDPEETLAPESEPDKDDEQEQTKKPNAPSKSSKDKKSDEDEPEGLPWWIFVIVGVAAIGIGIAIGLLILKKRSEE